MATRRMWLGTFTLACALVLAIPEAVALTDPPWRGIVGGVSYTLRSEALGDHREINVWTPPSYEQGEERYTVVYVLDGAQDQDFPHIAGLGQLGALSWTYESLIIVGVQTRDRQHELTPRPHDQRYISDFPRAGGAEDFRRFLTTEVVPFVEATYRTGSRRALMGESLAGLFVVDTFLNTPELFGDYIAVSPSLWWDDRALVRDARNTLARHGPSDRRLYLTIADEGGTMRDGMRVLTRALRRSSPQGLDWVFDDRSASETHATIYHGAALAAFRRFYALPPYDTGPTPWFMVDGAAPPQ